MKKIQIAVLAFFCVTLFSCDNKKKQGDKTPITMETMKDIAKDQQEMMENVERNKREKFEKEFDVNAANLWLRNKIISSYRGAIAGSPTLEEVSLIKTLNVNYCETNLEVCKFIAEGVTMSDMAFKYSFIIRKINGYYSIDKTNAPNDFYN